MNRDPVVVVESIHAHGMREINALEARIVVAEDDADAMLWQQAEEVVQRLDAGLTQRDLAAQWTNVRTGEAYTQAHVSYVKQVVDKFTYQDPRPRFRDAYNEIANASKPHVTHNSGDNEWYTPAELIEAARTVLGVIDLDPASSPLANETVKARQFYSRLDNGLSQHWQGRVWMNPPYAKELIGQFAEKFTASVQAGQIPAGIVLVNNATETEWFGTLATVATAVCFPEGRVRFKNPATETGAPLQGQAVLYTGPDVSRFAECFSVFGRVWTAMG